MLAKNTSFCFLFQIDKPDWAMFNTYSWAGEPSKKTRTAKRDDPVQPALTMPREDQRPSDQRTVAWYVKIAPATSSPRGSLLIRFG